MGCGCLDCTDITIPTGSTGATGPQGPAGNNGTNGTNGTDGIDGASLINSLYSRLSTSAVSLSEITNIPIDVTKVFSNTGDSLDYELLFTFDDYTGTGNGAGSIYLEDGLGGSINLFPNGSVPTITGGGAIIMKGSIERRSDSTINHKLVCQTQSNEFIPYTSPTAVLVPGKAIETITINPGSVDNTSVSLKLAVKGYVNTASNSIIIAYFRVVSLKKLI